MVGRPSVDTLESLRVTLQTLEQASSTMQDASALADLKRMVLLRIAELEAANTLPHDEVVEPSSFRADDAA